MTPKITAHYCELTWFRPWFHLVPHVCTNTKFQLTIVNWFGSGFGSTWFRMLAEAPNLSSLLGIDLVPLGSTSRQGPGNLSSHFWCKGSLGTKNLGEVLVVFVLAQKLTLPKPSQQIQRSNLLQSDSDWSKWYLTFVGGPQGSFGHTDTGTCISKNFPEAFWARLEQVQLRFVGLQKHKENSCLTK